MNFHSRRGFLSWSVAGLGAGAVSPWNLRLARSPVVLFRGPGPIELSSQATHIQLTATTGEMSWPRTTGRLELLLRGLTASGPPGVTYCIHLNPGDAPPRGCGRALGTIDFDGALRHRYFDIVPSDLGRAMPPDKITVSIVPAGKPDAGAAPMIAALVVLAG